MTNSIGTSTVLDMPGVSDTRAFGIDGSNIVGWYYNGGSYHGFLVPIPEPGPLSLLALGGLMIPRRRRGTRWRTR